jgi:1-acyl-sn-glycerol-3-phosphate acyltransferase
VNSLPATIEALLKLLRGLLHSALLYLLLLQLGLMSLAWSLVALLLHPLLPRARATILGRAVISHTYRWFWASAQALGMMRIESDALDVLQGEPTGLIIAANHPSMLDALLLVARLPRGVCIMKAALMRNIFLGPGARLARYIRNDSVRGMIRAAVASLREGGQLVFFPEGTRTTVRPINAFRPGFTLIAHKAQVPIQTVFIETDSPYLGKGWPIWRTPPVPIVVRARLGKRFAPEADHQALLLRIEAYFARELAA